MPMHRRRVQALHVVKRHGWIDQESEDAGAHKIPEGNSNKEVNGPLVRRNPLRVVALARKPNIFPRFETNQNEGHHFERAEYRAKSNHRRRSTGEIKMMERADDASRQEHHG